MGEGERKEGACLWELWGNTKSPKGARLG